MILAIVGIVLMLALFGGIGFAVYYQIKKTDPANHDKSVKKDINCSQDFLPFKDIKDGIIDLGGHRYRLLLECSSINYKLKTNKEQEIIEVGFHRFLNSLTFPITFFVQTKVFNDEERLKDLHEELQSTVENYPQLQEYANVYYNSIEGISDRLGTNKEKKKYVIVPYDEAINLTNLNDKEKFDYALKEIYKRAYIIAENLSPIGVKATVLRQKETLETIYSVLHRDNYTDVESIFDETYMKDLILSNNPELGLFSEKRFDSILHEAQKKLEHEIGKNAPLYVKENMLKSIEELEAIRKALAGYYMKEGDVSE